MSFMESLSLKAGDSTTMSSASQKYTHQHLETDLLQFLACDFSMMSS